MLIFLHVPKTAGSSFVRAMTKALNGDETWLLYGAHLTSKEIVDAAHVMPPSKKEQLKFIGGHQVWFGIHRLFPEKDCHYVTFLRDPVSRVVSNYYKILRDHHHAHHSRFIHDGVQLEEYLRGDITPVVRNHMTVFLGRESVEEWHNKDQCVTYDEVLLARAVGNLRKFWFVGLSECFRADLDRISDLTGLDLREFHINTANSHSISRRHLSLNLLKVCSALNGMDAVLYHSAVLQHGGQTPPHIIDGEKRKYRRLPILGRRWWKRV